MESLSLLQIYQGNEPVQFVDLLLPAIQLLSPSQGKAHTNRLALGQPVFGLETEPGRANLVSKALDRGMHFVPLGYPGQGVVVVFEELVGQFFLGRERVL